VLYILSLTLESTLVCVISLFFREGFVVVSLLLIYTTLRPTLGPQRGVLDLVCGILLPIALVLVRFGVLDGDTYVPLGTATILLLAGSLAGLAVKYRKRFAKRTTDAVTREAHDQMLATLAHEIRTPLTIMQTTEHVLMEQIPGPLNARQKKFMESIFINTHRLITFSENMLTLLKMERDWQPDLSKPIDLRLLIRQVAQTMEPMLLVKRQQIKYSFPALLSRPKADETWIRQVLINLVHNASKHTEEEGTILITVTQDDEQVVVTVTDTGHGLLGNERETLFREFYQENQDKQEYQDGFGLGLSIVRAIIERHHGKVYITSTKEMGTMVSFNLPAEASR
jgi:signal transduction histidine kinase